MISAGLHSLCAADMDPLSHIRQHIIKVTTIICHSHTSHIIMVTTVTCHSHTSQTHIIEIAIVICHMSHSTVTGGSLCTHAVRR